MNMARDSATAGEVQVSGRDGGFQAESRRTRRGE